MCGLYWAGKHCSVMAALPYSLYYFIITINYSIWVSPSSFLWLLLVLLVLRVVELLSYTCAQFETAVRANLLKGLQKLKFNSVSWVFMINWLGLSELIR